MSLLLFIFDIIIYIGFFVCVSGFILYKGQVIKADSWEDSIRIMITSVCKFFYEGITGVDIQNSIANTSLILVDREILDLVKSFENHPYDTPTLALYVPNQNGVLWVDIHAIKLTSTYKDLSFTELSNMAFHIVQNYYMETRGINVNVYIKIATPTRLYFAIPLSVEGNRFLEKQHKCRDFEQLPSFDEVLEEEIDLFGDSGRIDEE